MPIKAVLFDMFDTLMLIEKDHEFYTPSIRRMYHYLSAQGIDVPFERFEQTYIIERNKIFAKADACFEEPHFNVRVAATLQALGHNYDVSNPVVATATAEFCEEFMKYVRIDADTKPTLTALQKRYRLGMVSNFAIPECVLKLLHDGGIDKLFDVIVISGAVNKRKPNQEIFTCALEKMDLKPEEAVFVGDTIDADIEGAKAAGMKAIYIERRTQKASEKFVPDQTIKRLSELPSILSSY
ncbi:MAG TPA: HAD family hydrolase [Candidatus Acidoferrales bacterium]|nr:HAD family hydrolase [Candidatus Acidoferrales bacterium]